MAIVSSGRRLRTSNASDDCTSPSRSRMSIEPDVSMTNVRLAGGRASAIELAGRDADADHRRVVLGGRCRLDRDRQVGIGGGSVAVGEGVDPLLDADRVRFRSVAVGEERLGDVERAGVDVEGERRLPVVLGRHPQRVTGVDERVVVEHAGLVDDDRRRPVRRTRRQCQAVGVGRPPVEVGRAVVVISTRLLVLAEVRLGVDGAAISGLDGFRGRARDLRGGRLRWRAGAPCSRRQRRRWQRDLRRRRV